MKNIRTALAAGLFVLGAATVASAQNPTRPGRARAGQVARRQAPARLTKALFHGIKLSDTEKANVKNVHAKYEPQLKALREQFKAQTPIARGDTAARKARWEANAGKRDQLKQIMQSERAELRTALTAENQAKFDANVKRIQARLEKRAQRVKARVGK